jgi:hypothetical protein
MSAYQPGSYESPDITDVDLAGPEDGALGQLRNLYARAERMRPETIGTEDDGQFDQLLERQRKLISEYFRESSGLEAFEPAGPGPGTGVADATANDTLMSFSTGRRGAW